MKDPTAAQLRKKRKLLRVAENATRKRIREEKKMAKRRQALSSARKEEERALAELNSNITPQQPKKNIPPQHPKSPNAAQAWVRICEADAASDNVSNVG